MRRHWQLALFYLLLLAAWQTVCEIRVFPDYVLPPPRAVAGRLAELWRDGVFLPSLKVTLSRMFAGYGLSAATGLALGVLMGTSRLLREALRSLLLGLQSLPSAAWVPISLLLFGLQDKGIYFVIVMSSVGMVAVATADGLARVPPQLVRAARTLGTPPHAIGYRVMLPAALPAVAGGIKLGWTMGWHGAVSAELIKSSVGLGFLLHMGRELNDVAQIVGMMLVMVLIGVAVDRAVFGAIERWLRTRWGLHEQDHG